MTTTTPFTETDDILNAFIKLEADMGLNGAGGTVVIKDQIFDAGAGIDTFTVDKATSDFGSKAHDGQYGWITGNEAGVITLTNSSGGSVTISNLEKLEFSDLKIDLGTSAANTLTGSANNDGWLFGLGGNDKINGLAGNDLIYGGAGSDTLMGDAGLDTITGGAGRDIMSGGAGKDVFDFNAVTESSKSATARDVIKDFTHGADKIDLKTIDANTKTAGDQAFKFIGTTAFHKAAGELHVVQTDAAGTAHDVTVVQCDLNGDGVADFTIELSGLKALTAADFVL
jgi:Ca2+-binding RTX toxin-like protein